ncbi:hypothetical protein EVAR_7085_1 [Eumeta japonica]|uniref:Uncharacterized protein n=1 Tax=Eumeta variegata TaxID=151549 RepID=A0A4C1Y8Y3_EUMVA|nr:hypothetical protein EVAR_7085_1 [Eumeta japonica]
MIREVCKKFLVGIFTDREREQKRGRNQERDWVKNRERNPHRDDDDSAVFDIRIKPGPREKAAYSVQPSRACEFKTAVTSPGTARAQGALDVRVGSPALSRTSYCRSCKMG